MFRSILNYIKKLFGSRSITSDYQIAKNNRYSMDYKNIKDVNFTSIFANKFASLVTNESELLVTDNYDTPSKRTEMLNDIVNRVFGKRGKNIVAKMCGTGGVAIMPFVSNGKLYADIVDQSRFFIDKRIGDDIYSATVLSEILEIDNVNYYRWVHYNLEDDKTFYITNIATTESGIIPLSLVPEWATIEPVIGIKNCDKPLFTFLRCPIDNRGDDDGYGVPITYGCEKTIKKIYECLDQIDKEFANKEAFIGLDSRMFGPDDNIPSSGIFKKLEAGGMDGDFWQIFSPEIRDSAYYNRLTNLFDLLEKQVGSSKGVLTEKNSAYATATEIKAGNYDTYSIVDGIRRELEEGINDFVYSCSVLIDFFNLAPNNDYRVVFNWSYALIENSQETWQQYESAVGMGIMKKAEARQFLVADESLEESERVIKEIEAEEKSRQQETRNQMKENENVSNNNDSDDDNNDTNNKANDSSDDSNDDNRFNKKK